MAIILCFLLVATFFFIIAASKILYAVCWTPLRIQQALRAQGITGPPYRILHGNLSEFLALTNEARASSMPPTCHDIMPRVLPHYRKWSKEYGNPFLYWLGYRSRLTVSDPDLCKEILSNKFGHYPKPGSRPDLKDLLGDGLLMLEGEKWAQHRRIVNPAFFIEKLKAMTPTIANVAAEMLHNWQQQLQEEGISKEINVHEEFGTLTADIIAHTAFGSSYAEGKEVFKLQYEQQVLFEKIGRSVYIPGSRFVPSATNRYRWKLNQQISTTLQKIIDSRLDSPKVGRSDLYGNDLLGLMMAAYRMELQGSQKNLKMGMQEIIDECKTFFFAGHETTASLLTWTVMLLAVYPEWQEQAREEVFTHCCTNHPTAEVLNQLKIVGMVLNESLRLYPPAIAVFREASNEMKLGNILIPRGTTLFLPILALHVNPDYWGNDAHVFNPLRFVDGVLKACKHPMAFLPFSTGPRNCVGQNFALMEAKIVLSMILQRFRFHLSPGYKHAPSVVLTLQPEYGVQIIFENITT